MILQGASYIVTFDKDNTIIKNGGIVFDKKILDIGDYKTLKKRYPNIKHIKAKKNSILLPGLINSHIHLEFSSNKTSLQYGNFISWLNSVMKYREKIIENSNTKCIQNELKNILKTGTTTIGAISSYGFDMNECINTPLNVVYFNEIIGSQANMIDTLLADYKARIKNSMEYKSDSFIPSIAIHSPYSVHPFLLREVLNIAKQNDLKVTSHFLESNEEKEWLESSSGNFLDFFQKHLNQNKSITTSKEFLNQFKNIKDLSFTHCLKASKEELNIIKELKASINCCITSNRLLNNSVLNLDNLQNINYSIGTDGLSSNYSLNMFDELRNGLLVYKNKDINTLSYSLLKASTKGGAIALGLNKGELSINKDCDMILVNLPDELKNPNSIYLNIILHTKKVYKTIIGGQYV
jgi:aminodeoxyfutalosine deaminase